jgi:hypothetical protein
VYARDVDKKTLTFAVSGLLWNRSLVMKDEETGSLWSHVLGEAKSGSLKGVKLKQVPSVITDWATWRRENPGGTIVLLSRTSHEYTREFYANPEQFVLGIVESGEAKSWGLDTLSRSPAVNDRLGKRAVLAAFDKSSLTARLYERKLGDRVLTFRLQDGQLTDEQTGSTWNPVTGQAVAGQLEGKHLTALPAILSYRIVWQRFHPPSENTRRK